MMLRIRSQAPNGTIQITPTPDIHLAAGYLRTMHSKRPECELRLERFEILDNDWVEWFDEFGRDTNDLLRGV